MDHQHSSLRERGLITPATTRADIPVIRFHDGTERVITTYDLDRFLAQLTKDTSGCWTWASRTNPQGYGRFTVGRNLPAHRFAYIAMVAPVADHLQLDHLCRNRACVNPAHLEPVTAAENTRRSDNPAARNARKTHCTNGHPFDEANTRIDARGWRVCIPCDRARGQRGYAKATDRPMADGEWIDRRFGPKTHCPQGHPYDAENTYLSPRGERHCRSCRRMRRLSSKAGGSR